MHNTAKAAPIKELPVKAKTKLRRTGFALVLLAFGAIVTGLVLVRGRPETVQVGSPTQIGPAPASAAAGLIPTSDCFTYKLGIPQVIQRKAGHECPDPNFEWHDTSWTGATHHN